MNRRLVRGACALLALGATSLPAAAQGDARAETGANATAGSAAGSSVAGSTVVGSAVAGNGSLPSDYIIGVEDVLRVVFWRDDGLSGDVVVRPDGKISVPLLNDVHAAGLTPVALSKVLEDAAREFILNPNVTVIVSQVNSRRVFVVGEVMRPGTVALNSEMNMLQLIAAVGGFQEYAKRNEVVIVREQNGREERMRFHYDDVVRGRKPEQNILLRPGDTILVR